MSHVRAEMGLVGVQMGQVWGQICHHRAQIDKNWLRQARIWHPMGQREGLMGQS